LAIEADFQTNPAAWIEHGAAEYADRPFLTEPSGRRLTYQDLERHTQRLAATLDSLGVAPGERIVVQVEKSTESVLLYLAALRFGAVLVPLNTAYTAAELEYFLTDASPRLAVFRPQDKELLEPIARRAGCATVETLGASGEGSLLELTRQDGTQTLPTAGLGPDSLAALIYTSGTTGRSKGAMLTRRNLASNAMALADCWRFTSDDVLLHALPLFHVHGLFVAINTVLAAGASLVLAPKFDAAEVLRQLRVANVFMGVPTHYTRLLQQQDLSRETTAHVRLFVSGSAPLLAETHREFERRTGQVILERYGMTETLMNASNPYEGLRLPGAVGLPLPGVQVRVTGPESVGMLEIRGPNVFAGYWNDAKKTAESFTADGFFITGDLGSIDETGYIHIVGRAKDVVISGGYNVYPKEIEAELDAIPGVIESAVIGVPHPDLGEAVAAILAVAPGANLRESDVLGALQNRLARYKIPRLVRFVEELPRNAMGKVQKAELRRTYRGDS
jgi:malonyl-CoA/methylmalonyl-CoA synthetase